MEARQPTLAELIDALPREVADLHERAPAREELARLLAGSGTRPIPTGRLTRFWSMGTLQAKIAMAYLAWWLRSGFQDAERKRRGLDETHVAAAIQVLARMTYLRGAVMKLGQVLAHWPDVLPGAFAEVLGHLHSEAPPMHFALLREHVRRELGADPTEVFDDFEPEAFAAASLGQVHRARLKGTQRRVAIKIQYPDIARTIREDLANLKAVGFGMRLSGDWQNLLLQFEGIQRMLEQETDYEHEAELQEAARRRLAGLDEVVVPRVFPEHSTRRILTMEYLEGRHLEPFLATGPSQELRDRHGAQMTRATQRLWYGERLVYADPHPGNFLFLPDGRLGLLDFGCCHRFSAEEFEYVLDVERLAFSGDEERLVAALGHGCDIAPAQLEPERLALMRAYCEWVWKPIRTDEPFDYGDPDQYREGVRHYGEFMRRRWVRSQPVNVWLTKVFFGLRAMLTHLGARVAYGRILREESPLGSRP
jgi:predicted unusual protein kinase regulating ubiquinone biosynthesis (AarF/ABC1/UbiB family)